MFFDIVYRVSIVRKELNRHHRMLLQGDVQILQAKNVDIAGLVSAIPREGVAKGAKIIPFMNHLSGKENKLGKVSSLAQ